MKAKMSQKLKDILNDDKKAKELNKKIENDRKKVT